VRRRVTMPPVGWFSVVLFACYATYSVALHHRFRTAGFDLGIFDQAVRSYARFESPVVPIKGEGFIHLGDHFHPIVATLAPLYWLWDDPRTLLVAQAGLVCAAIPVVHRFAWRRLQHWSAWCVTFGFALGWPLQQLVHFQFHELAFGVPLMAVALDALDRRADRTLVVACLALLLVREDMGLLVAMMGLLRAWSRPRALGVGMVVGGLTAFVVITKVVMSHFSPAGEWLYWSYDALGEDAESALVTILTHPLQALQLMFDSSVKRSTWLALFLPLLFVPLCSRYVLVGVPVLVAQFLTSRELLWLPSYHYWGPLWVVLVVAFVDGLVRLRRLRGSVVPVAPVFLASVTALGVVLVPGLYPVQRVVTGAVFEVEPHEQDQRALLDQIPASTCVEADNFLVPHLTATNKVSGPGRLTAPPADFVALDMSQEAVEDRSGTPEGAKRDAEAAGYTEVWQQGDLVLLRAPDYDGPTPACAG